MNSVLLALRVSSVVFGFISLAHVLRILGSVRLQVGSMEISEPLSALAAIIMGALGWWMWLTAQRLEAEESHHPHHEPAATHGH